MLSFSWTRSHVLHANLTARKATKEKKTQTTRTSPKIRMIASTLYVNECINSSPEHFRTRRFCSGEVPLVGDTKHNFTFIILSFSKGKFLYTLPFPEASRTFPQLCLEPCRNFCLPPETFSLNLSKPFRTYRILLEC